MRFVESDVAFALACPAPAQRGAAKAANPPESGKARGEPCTDDDRF